MDSEIMADLISYADSDYASDLEENCEDLSTEMPKEREEKYITFIDRVLQPCRVALSEVCEELGLPSFDLALWINDELTDQILESRDIVSLTKSIGYEPKDFNRRTDVAKFYL